MKTITSIVTAFVLTLILTANSFAAVDFFLKIEGTKGEGIYKAQIDPATGACTVTNVPEGTYKVTLVGSAEYFTTHGGTTSDASTIEISSFSWGVSNSSSAGSGMGTGKVSYSDLSVMKTMDKSSPSLSKGCAGGNYSHKSCPLSVRKAGKDQQEYYTVTLQNIQISGSNENPSESLSKGNGGTKTGYDVKACVKI